MGSAPSKQTIADEFSLENHEYIIKRCTFSNGKYAFDDVTEYITDGFKERQNDTKGSTGSAGPIGPTGTIGPTDPSNVIDAPSGVDMKVEYRRYDAFVILAFAKEDNAESYTDLVKPFASEYDDAGVEIEINKPYYTKLRGLILPKYENEVIKINTFNKELNDLNQVIDNVFIKISDNPDFDIDTIDTSHFHDLKETLQVMKDEINGYIQTHNIDGDRLDLDTSYNHSYSGYDTDDDYDDCYCKKPVAGDFHKREKIIPDHYYFYTKVWHYNKTNNLIIKCHEGTKMYSKVKDLLEKL